MKATLKKIAALTLTLAFAFGINAGLNSAMDSDALDSLFSGNSSQTEIYASGNTMLPDSPHPRDLERDKEDDEEVEAE